MDPCVAENILPEGVFRFFLWSEGHKRSIAQKLAEDLKNRGYKCKCSWISLQPEHPILDFVHECVQKSKWTLICLEDEDLNIDEFMKTLNASLMKESCVLLIVTPAMDKKLRNTEWTKHKQMPFVQRCVVQNDNCTEEIITLCSKMLRAEIPGCLAHGLVFSQFVGFWSHILKGIQEKIQQSSTYEQNPATTATRLYIILPMVSDFKMPTLKDGCTSAYGVQIKPTEEKLTLIRIHAGKKRELILTIFQVSKGNQTFYCVADIPNVLQTIYTLSEFQINDINMAAEIERFYYTANMLLNHSEYCPDTVKILLYNDQNCSKEDILFEALCNDLSTDSSTKLQISQPPDRLLSRSSSMQQYNWDVMVLTDESVQQDREISSQVYASLPEDLRVFRTGPVFNGLNYSKWHIFVISTEALKNSYMHSFCRFSLSGNEVRTIILVRDIDPVDLPDEFKFAFVFNVEEPLVVSKILKAMNGEPINLEYSLPTGDVATGLAWGYGLNYLNLTLGGGSNSSQVFTSRVENFVRENADVGEGCINKFYSFCPSSCTCPKEPKDIEQKDSERSITLMGPLQEYTADVGAAIGRSYQLFMYQYTNTRKNRFQKVCFVCEYCTPINCLGEMANTYKFAGLLKDKLTQQRELFRERLLAILSCDSVKKTFGDYSHLVELIYFDDVKETLLDVMEREIGKEELPIIKK